MKRIINIGRTVGAILFLAIVAGSVVLFATGKISAAKMRELFSPSIEEKTRPQAAPEPAPDLDEVARKNIEQSKELERRRADQPVVASAQETILYALKDEVDSRRTALDKDREALAAARAELEKSKKEFETKVSDDGFKQGLEILQKMDPKDAARTIYLWKDEDILRYFRQMKAAALTEIIAELNKYPAKATEGQRGAELLNKLDKFTFDAGTTTAGN